MRARTFAVLMAALLLAWPAAAQEQRAVIEGVVKDTTGAVVPGAAVEAKALTGAVLSTTTNAQGVYRFPSVAPSTYTVTASLTGFGPRTVEDVRIGLGQIKVVDFTLPVAGVAETVDVLAVSPLVDVRQPTRQTNIRAEQIELLPKGRDFTSLVTQASGVNIEPKLGGVSIDGASAGENRFIIDGIETTDPQDGTSGMPLIADFVEEVQVKSSGYTAEFGGSTGGVINVLTKSGTNELRGIGSFQFQGSALAAERARTLRRNPINDQIAEHIVYPKDEETRIEPGFSIGGPIVQNRSWFYGAYQPAITRTERTVDPTTAQNPGAGTFNETRRSQVQYALANITSQWSNALRSRVSFTNSWQRDKGQLPSLTGTDLPGTNYRKTSSIPNWALAGNLDWTATPNFFVGVRAGYRLQDVRDTEVTEGPRIVFSVGNNLNIPGVPENLRRASGFQTVVDNFKSNQDQFTRMQLQADGTWFGSMAGRHQLKFGVQIDRLGNSVDFGETGNRVLILWDRALSGQRGTFGYYRVRSNAVDPKRGFITQGDITQTVLGLFVNDQWTINDRLTLNLGIRTERERVPNYSTVDATSGRQLGEIGLEFPFSEKIAPRLGAAYDVFGDGRTKAFGSWGIFYDIFKLELPRGSFGGDKWLEYYFALDTFDWTNLINSPNCPPACAGRLLRGPVDFRHVSGPFDPAHPTDGGIDPDLKPMKMQEATAGVEHQLNDRMAVSVRYVHKQLDKAIEDVGALDAQSNEIYVIANPGFGLTAFAHPGVPHPKAVRDYDSVEFAFEKKFVSSWFFRTSYLWSRLWGNYSGLSQSDENGRTSPNIGRVFDYPLMMFMDGGEPVFGHLPTDRPHQFKTQFIYSFDFGTSIGLDQFVASGLPVTREIGIYPPNNLPVQYLGRGSDGRTPVFSQTNLLVQHGFRIGERRFDVFFNVLNLFNQETTIGRFSTYHDPNGVSPDEDAFYTGRQRLADLIVSQRVNRDPRFLLDNQFQLPLQARIGARFTF